jgi:hypothetical protein
MSETLNVNVLVAAKEEYTRQLISSLQAPVYEIIKNVYTESQKNNIRRDISYSNFQLELKKVPNWASFKLDENLSEINSKFPYLMDLITAIFVSHVKILACVRLKSDNKSIKIKVPNLNTFLHKIIINVSETIYYDPYVIHDQKDKIFTIITTSITETIANQIPIEYILNEYLSGVFEDDEEQANIYEPPGPELDEEEASEEDEDNEENEEREIKNIPIIPIDNPVRNVPKPEKLDEIKVDKKEPELESFEDLKEKKDIVKSFKVDKKDIISDDDLSDEDISDYEDEDKDTDIKDETEPDIKEDPTLF